MRLRFGDVISVSRRFARKTGQWRCIGWRERYWEAEPIDETSVIFLGMRHLRNGAVHYDRECGNTFSPDDGGTFRAMLVCADGLRPFYAPIPQEKEETK